MARVQDPCACPAVVGASPARAGDSERQSSPSRPAPTPVPLPVSLRRWCRAEGRGEGLAAPAQSGGFSREDGRHYRISPTHTTRIPQPTR